MTIESGGLTSRIDLLLSEMLSKTEPADTQTVGGTVTANAGTGTFSVGGTVTAGPSTNNIGDVDVLTLPALPTGSNNIGDVDVLTIAAGTNRVGGVYEVSGQVIDETGVVRTVQRAFANATASGNTQVVAAQAGLRVRVLSYAIVCLLAVNVKFQSATTDISAALPFAANGGVVVPYNVQGLFQTASDEALNVNLSLATTVGVNVVWIAVP